MRATMVNDLAPLMDLPLVSLHLPGSPLNQFVPLVIARWQN